MTTAESDPKGTLGGDFLHIYPKLNDALFFSHLTRGGHLVNGVV
jgi:hypothetical protein